MGRVLDARAPPPQGPLIPGGGQPPEGGAVGQSLWGHLRCADSRRTLSPKQACDEEDTSL